MQNTFQDLSKYILDEASLGFVVCKMESGEVVYFNKAAESLFDVPVSKIEELIPSLDRPPFLSFSLDLIKHEGLYQDVLIKKQSRSFVGNITVKDLSTQNGSLKLLTIQDVTLQKKLQREVSAKQQELNLAFEDLLKQNQQLKELDSAKDKFIALTTHELRTPLSAIVASSEVLKLGLYDNEEQLKEFIDMIHEQGNHLLELVNDILDFAKIRAGKMDFFIEQKEIKEFASHLFRSFSSMAEGSKIELIESEKCQEVLCYFDGVRLSQVLSNMITNAIKYNKPQGKVFLKIEDQGDFVKLTIEDTGKGISKENLSQVFNEFETLGQVSQHHKGTGLGMPISRKLIEGMGGKLELESELGVGSKFWIEIPKEKVLNEEVYRTRPNSTDDLAA